MVSRALPPNPFIFMLLHMLLRNLLDPIILLSALIIVFSPIVLHVEFNPTKLNDVSSV